jgi:hypothetical protein
VVQFEGYPLLVKYASDNTSASAICSNITFCETTDSANISNILIGLQHTNRISLHLSPTPADVKYEFEPGKVKSDCH